jgi:hypothetical protein|tara:strand:+ start:916 stop:1512 length:597 start_codon:yes stop_codon:yes gene_type:complete
MPARAAASLTTLRELAREVFRSIIATAKSRYPTTNDFPLSHFVLVVDRKTWPIVTALFSHDELIALGAADVHFVEDPNRAEHVEMDAVYFLHAVDAALAQTLNADFRMLTQAAHEGAGGGGPSACSCITRLLYLGMGTITYDARRYRAAHVFSQTAVAPKVVALLKSNEILYSVASGKVGVMNDYYFHYTIRLNTSLI